MLFLMVFFKANNLPEKISTSLHCSELNTSLLAVQLLEASGGKALPAMCCMASNASAIVNRNLYSTVKQLCRHTVERAKCAFVAMGLRLCMDCKEC